MASSAQTIRVILLASATRTSIGGLRVIMLANHDPGFAPLRDAQPATALAPTMSRRRNVRSPILEMRPSRSLPPLDRCTGVSPSQAAKSRPRRNVAADGANATSTGNGHQPPCNWIIFRAVHDLGIKLENPLVKRTQFDDEHLQHDAC